MTSQLLDSFDDVSGWSPVASGQAELHISQDQGPRGHAMRLDFDFKGGGGFVVARRRLVLPLPETYAFTFALRGVAPRNKLEFKLIDATGQNVWRYQEDAFEFPPDWHPMRIRSSQIEFGWGPAGGGTMHEMDALELVIAAGPGGKGTVWIAELGFEDRTVRATPQASASSAIPGHEPARVIDGSAETSWRSASSSAPQWLLLDFQEVREFGGLVIQWESDAARGFDVQVSDDGAAWKTMYSASRAAGLRSYVYLPDAAARYLRLNFRPGVAGQALGITEVEIKPYDFSRSMNGFFEAIAAESPRGSYPKYLYSEQTYWTPVGIPPSVTRGLLNQEGMLEVDEGTFSIEPFLYLDDALVTWADVAPRQALERKYLPIPSSLWRGKGIELSISACATGTPDDAVLYVRYRVENTTERSYDARLFAAFRPFQVTPPWQSWHGLGGVSPIREIEYRGSVVWVNGERAVIPLDVPSAFGAAAFAQGSVTDYLREGRLPAEAHTRDDFGYASGALAYDLPLAPQSRCDVYLAIPFGRSTNAPDALAALVRARGSGAEQFKTAVREWKKKLGVVDIGLPARMRAAGDTCKTAAAHILINRDGPALQPGPRRYTRSWIRDGAIMGAALLRMGCADEVRDFIRWYAPYQAADGQVPCCVDRSGPDWLVEYDSQGELIYIVMEYFRFTGDRAFLAEMWPAVRKSVEYIEALRRTRLTPEFQAAEKRPRYGLLPESVSHEGYLAHPVHAYWDDFWALRGLIDAAAMAEIVGERGYARQTTELRNSFRDTLFASINTTIAERQLNYVPGSVEWADFDPTATANAIALLGELDALPDRVVTQTFDEYLLGFRKRHTGQIDWANYTPYEIRIIGALVRLGRRADAVGLLDFFLSDRRPLLWNQWPEIAWRDPKSPGHLGDIPHSWISAEYILSLRSMVVFEREADQSLVIGAGLPEKWIAARGGVAMRGLPTWYGTLDFTMQRRENGTVCLTLGGDLTMPPGSIVIRPPLDRPLRDVTVNGSRARNVKSDEATIEEFPAEVVMS